METNETRCEDMKVLNLYAGIGGNRKLWTDVEVTAVEWNKEIADIYQDFFPDDKVVIGDAHQFLLDHFKEYDFIWSSPPCPTHSLIRKNTSYPRGQVKPYYSDMRLYQEIIFLKGFFEGLYCVENVKSWYDPLIRPQVVSRHYLWANFLIVDKRIKHMNLEFGVRKEWEERLGFNLEGYNGFRKDTALRNCVDPELGAHILDCARGTIQQKLL